jgi:hypothetical protein
MNDYRALLPRLKQIRKTPKYTASPYFIAFESMLGEISDAAEYYPVNEKIDFVFDRQKEFQGRAKELYDMALQTYDNKTLGYYPRLGSLKFSSDSTTLRLRPPTSSLTRPADTYGNTSYSASRSGNKCKFCSIVDVFRRSSVRSGGV